MVNAVVLGGGGDDERLVGFYDGPTKALIPVHGRPSLAWVLDALHATPLIGKVAVSGPKELAEHEVMSAADVFMPDTGSIIDKVLHAAELFADGRKIIMVCCDTPLITASSLTKVIEACPEDCSVFHPVVSYESAQAYCPDHLWTPLKLRDRTIVTTNIFITDPNWMERRRELLKDIEDLRRRPLRLALRFGLMFLIRFRFGLLSLEYCEAHLSKLLGAPCRGWICDLPELTLDLDRPDDAPLLESKL